MLHPSPRNANGEVCRSGRWQGRRFVGPGAMSSSRDAIHPSSWVLSSRGSRRRTRPAGSRGHTGRRAPLTALRDPPDNRPPPGRQDTVRCPLPARRARSHTPPGRRTRSRAGPPQWRIPRPARPSPRLTRSSRRRIMVLDGTMGSLIFARQPTEEDYRGARDSPAIRTTSRTAPRSWSSPSRA